MAAVTGLVGASWQRAAESSLRAPRPGTRIKPLQLVESEDDLSSSMGDLVLVHRLISTR
jgi:hypothetical protein